MKILKKFILGILLFASYGAILNGSFRVILEQRELKFRNLFSYSEQEELRTQLSTQLTVESRLMNRLMNRLRNNIGYFGLEVVEQSVLVLERNLNRGEFENNLYELLNILNPDNSESIIKQLNCQRDQDVYFDFSGHSITPVQLVLMIPVLSKFKKICRLDLAKNDLNILPESIGRLNNLEFLILFENQLESLPSSFCECSKLNYLDLGHNPLTGLLRDIIEHRIILRPSLNLYVSGHLFESEESNKVEGLSGDESGADESGADEIVIISVGDLLNNLKTLSIRN